MKKVKKQKRRFDDVAAAEPEALEVRAANEVLGGLDDEQKATIFATGAYMEIVSEMYNSVLDQCGVGDDERVYYREMLVRHSENALVASMLGNLSDEYVKHLGDFMEQERVINPAKDAVACLIDFTVMYPELREKAYEALDEFFKEFIEDVRRLRG